MANIYKNTALNSSELTQIVTLPCNIEYKAKEITGGNYIKLVNADFANVSIYFNTKKDRSTAKILNNSNRGLIWKEANPITGEAYLYNNFYIWTEGTSTTDLVLEVSSNGEILTPLLGNTAVTDSIIQGLSTQAQINLNNAINNTYTYNNPIQFFESGYFGISVGANQNKKFIYYPFFDDIATGLPSLQDDLYYRVNFYGHIDFSQDLTGDIISTWDMLSQQTIHLFLFNNDLGATITETTEGQQQLPRPLYIMDKIPYSYNNYFDIKGLMTMVGIKPVSVPNLYVGGGGIGYQTDNGKVDVNFIVKGAFIKQFDYLAIGFNVAQSSGGTIDCSMHYTLIMTIGEAYTNILPA